MIGGDALVWVLVVDDDPLVGRMMARLLRGQRSLEVRAACGLREARAALSGAEEPPLAVLLDYDLGGGEPDGIEVLEALREDGHAGPVAFCTGSNDRLVRRRLGAEHGRIPCFSKPIDCGHLTRWLDEQRDKH